MKAATATALIGFAIALTLATNDARAAPFLPDFGAATFVPDAPIDNPYFPLLDKKTRVFVGETPDERFELTVLGAGPIILGVQTTARRDRSFEDGLLVEDTFDYYAQDSIGNVWYFGEDVTNFHYDDEGNLIGTDNESAWRAGINGALPGYIMPVDLTVGFNYYQEFAAIDEALDQGTTFFCRADRLDRHWRIRQCAPGARNLRAGAGCAGVQVLRARRRPGPGRRRPRCRVPESRGHVRTRRLDPRARHARVARPRAVRHVHRSRAVARRDISHFKLT